MVMGRWCCIRGFYLLLIIMINHLHRINHRLILIHQTVILILVKEKSLVKSRNRKVITKNLFADRCVSETIGCNLWSTDTFDWKRPTQYWHMWLHWIMSFFLDYFRCQCVSVTVVFYMCICFIGCNVVLFDWVFLC